MAFNLGNVLSGALCGAFSGLARHKPDEEPNMSDEVKQCADDLAYRSGLSVNKMIGGQIANSSGAMQQQLMGLQQLSTISISGTAGVLGYHATTTTTPNPYNNTFTITPHNEMEELRALLKGMSAKLSRLESEVALLRSRQDCKDVKADEILRHMDGYIS